MIKTREDVDDLAAEVCPVCDGTRVRVVEYGWFVLELDRHDELRDAEPHRGMNSHDELIEDEPTLEFRCLSCGVSWT